MIAARARRLLWIEDLPAASRDPRVHVLLGLGAAWALTEPRLFGMMALAIVGAVGVVLAWRHPMASLVAAAAFVPYQQVVQSWLTVHRVLSPSNATYLGYAKDLVIAVVAVRVWLQRGSRRASTIDHLAIAVLLLTLVYLLLPVGAPLRARYVAARGDAGFALVFLLARWLPASDRFREVTQRVFVVSAGVIAALAAWNRFGPKGWTDWVRSTGLVEFRRLVLNTQTFDPVIRVDFGGSQVIRAGSLFLSPNDCAYFLLVAFAIVAARFLSGRSRPWEPWVGGLVAVGVFFTFSRSAMVLVLLVSLVAASGAGRLSRTAGALATLGVVLAVAVGLLLARDQVGSGFDTSDSRTSEHVEALGEATSRMLSKPFGSGLGTASATAIRFDVANRLQNSENFYLRVGAQTGIVGALLTLGFIVAMARGAWARARSGSGIALAAAAAITGLAVGAIFLDTFSELATTWMAVLLAGLALPATPTYSATEPP